MSQRLTTSFVNTPIPGAYVEENVQSLPVGISNTGVIAIIGEADGGADYSAESNLKNNFFSPTQADVVKAKYISGPIVDAMNALAVPSADPLINGSVSGVYILKTNAGAKASAIVDSDYGTLSYNNYGVKGNLAKYEVIASQAEQAPAFTGTAISSFGAALNAASFSIRLNGAAASVITLSSTAADHDNIADLVVELNALLPAGIVASAGASNSLVMTVAADAANFRKGWGKSFELVDSTSGKLALLGLTAGLVVSSAESIVEVSVIRSDIGLNETLEASGDIALQVGYGGTSASLTITSTALTTTVTGGSGANLNVSLNQFATISDLADFISSQPGYSAQVASSSIQSAPSVLDEVSAIGIAATGAGLMPGRIKRSLANFESALSTSKALVFAATAGAGLPSPMSSYAFLAGGSKGGTSGAQVVDALVALQGLKTNFVVPLFSQDATADIAAGLTSSSSTYTIDAIHAATKSHCLLMSQVEMKRNREAVLSFWGNYSVAKSKAQGLANYRCALAFQQCSNSDSQGNVQVYMPWYAACIAAGMQAAGFYRGITNKLLNVVSYIDPSGFDSGNPGSIEDALLAGMLIIQNESAGPVWVSDQTTYGLDTNFVYNSIQAVYLADITAIDLGSKLQRQFVGSSLADVDATSVEAYITQIMAGYRTAKVIVGDDVAPLGYRNVKVSISGPIMTISLEIKLSTSIYFIPITLNISQVQSAA